MGRKPKAEDPIRDKVLWKLGRMIAYAKTQRGITFLEGENAYTTVWWEGYLAALKSVEKEVGKL